ncbi:MAG: hypothetical protein WDN31_19135 [Hyphomicrobium sp.]
MAALLAEQRRIGDEFRSVEKRVLELRKFLARAGLTAPDRAEAEGMLFDSCAELMRLGLRQLELDASVSAGRRRVGDVRSPVSNYQSR